MIKININASRNYDVYIGSGLINETGALIRQIAPDSKILVITDDTVYSLYGERVISVLKDFGYQTDCFVFPHGEQSKNLETYGRILEYMSRAGMDRKDCVLALGGGVTGDLAGFAAATYQRGIGFIQMPTTLLAAVDSSVGGKTAVDLKTGKNQVGCFYQPMMVICDTDLLATLPAEQYECGCAEIIKYAVIKDEQLFNRIFETPVSDQLENVIADCVSIKRDYVLEDEFDRGARMALNFGHTFGHAIEALSGYNILHGQAVAAGMAIITRSAYNKNICDKTSLDRLMEILEKYGLPAGTDFSPEKLAEVAISDKKASGDAITIVVPETIGRYRLEKIKKADLISWIG